MKKALVLILTALLFVSLFISCGPEPKVQITIKFDGNGAEGQMSDQTVVKGEEFTLPDNAFKKTDNHFIGWNTAADGSGTMYPDGDTVSFNEDTTLYAQWAEDVVTIKFDANGGSGIMLPQWAIKGKETTLRQNRFSKEDWHFIGWNTATDRSGTWYTDADTAAFESDTTLYAQWAEDVVTIKFDANGGSGIMFPQWAIKNEATALRPNRFSWKNHVFLGWNTKKDGSGTKYADKAEITTASDITLFAQWAVDIVTLEDKYNWKESDGKYFTISDNLTLEEDRPEVRGNITLILPEGKTLSLGFGLGVNKGNSLTIDGSGNLEAEGTSMVYSGIGATIQDDVCGDITINGGNIYVRGGFGGAAIGGACYVDGGTITINGGTIEAVGGSTDWLGYGGAGIGGGGKGSGGNIIINGGKVTATGGENSDGIGKGQEGKDKGKLTLGKGVSIEVSDDGETWSPYKSDKRHRYMRTK